MSSLFFIVGLGNPGREYEWTRHNLGFMVVDLLAQQTETPVRRAQCRALTGRTTLEGRRVELVKPQTYMNLSGEAVACLARKQPEFDPRRDLLVICDDLALPLGTIRLRARGSAGGHNGLKSIIAALGTQDFMRLRIGIKPDHAVTDAAAFVLERFPASARQKVEEVVERSAEAVRAVLRDGLERAMAYYNQQRAE
ncbi:MAG: aminoacyl-tRNA hydrolase [Pyrinomonas sp.]|uniref:aminoacyl-tRNA hydrolase n=1 Tax=Pyrinomonas sp. TaxID=2080306 RepID=UPI0033271509